VDAARPYLAKEHVTVAVMKLKSVASGGNA
jgi:hypothetical protein